MEDGPSSSCERRCRSASGLLANFAATRTQAAVERVVACDEGRFGLKRWFRRRWFRRRWCTVGHRPPWIVDDHAEYRSMLVPPAAACRCHLPERLPRDDARGMAGGADRRRAGRIGESSRDEDDPAGRDRAAPVAAVFAGITPGGAGLPASAHATGERNPRDAGGRGGGADARTATILGAPNGRDAHDELPMVAGRGESFTTSLSCKRITSCRGCLAARRGAPVRGRCRWRRTRAGLPRHSRGRPSLR